MRIKSILIYKFYMWDICIEDRHWCWTWTSQIVFEQYVVFVIAKFDACNCTSRKMDERIYQTEYCFKGWLHHESIKMVERIYHMLFLCVFSLFHFISFIVVSFCSTYNYSIRNLLKSLLFLVVHFIKPEIIFITRKENLLHFVIII